MNQPRKPISSLVTAIAALCFTTLGGLSAPVYADTVDLSPTPPELTTSVAPNIALTFDDSGSMSFGYLPDGHTSCSWKYSWIGYNKIYYNPQVTYIPPLKADGSSFPDVSFTAAPLDGFHSYLGHGATTVDLSKDYRLTKEWDRDADADNNTMSTSCIPDDAKIVNKKGYVTESHAYYTLADQSVVDLTSITSGATVDGHTRTVAEEQQNFANWYSYYRTRSLMTKTAISQAFGSLTTDIQLIWQTIWPYSGSRNWGATISSSTTIGDFSGARKANFFDWMFKIRPSNSTPDRTATIRASEYFTGQGTAGTNTDPYWNGLSGADSAELSCRRNFHVLVTDGYWNESDSGVATPTKTADALSSTKDGRATKMPQSSIYWNVDSDYTKSMANIAYHYWATDLSGLDDDVSPYLADSTHNLWPGKTFDPTDPWANDEVYFNPKNDPATWQHVSQFIVTLGISGDRNFPGDYDDLRKGTIQWPKAVKDTATAIDDMWRAAIVSRGGYFSASDPTQLGISLANIIRSVAARTGSAVANTVNSGVVTSESVAYTGLYNSAGWNGSVKAHKQLLIPVKNGAGKIISVRTDLGQELWDADCLLTGDGCVSGTTTVATGRTPASRTILTSSDIGTGKGVPFQWSDLSSSEQRALNADPTTDIHSASIVSDGRGQQRLKWIRGDRSQEGVTLRSRTSLMGAVIRSQPLYVSYPDSGYRNKFPNTDPNGADTPAPENGAKYDDFVDAHKSRTPALYVGANDGMMHAIDAKTGEELFAYVPQSIYWRSLPVPNGANPDKPGVPLLGKLTTFSGFKFLPTVDNTPVKRDVFFGGAWHTLLVGTLGMGGRGVYALDVTRDPSSVTEATANQTVLWEFNNHSPGGSDLGYTYGQAAISRLATGKWVVLVPGGYFPKNPDDPNQGVAAAGNKFSSLFVLDAETGTLIRELKTSDDGNNGSVKSYGLATPVLGDYNDDQVDEVAFAGDLMGNLWRFDLSAVNPTSWGVDLVFEGKTDGSGNPLQPITAKPRLFPDPVTNQFIVVFGTGKYLGEDDRLRVGTPTQAVYGIREQGPSTRSGFPNGYYPVARSEFVTQHMLRQGNVRMLTNKDVPPGKTGWVLNLDVREGERVVQRAGALFNTNQALITTLIPSGNDPCNPDREGAQILISATTGGSDGGIDNLRDKTPDQTTGGETYQAVGVDFPSTGTGSGGPNDQLPSTGDSGSVQPVLVEPGGCRGVAASGLNVPLACWRRRSWQMLNQ